MLEAEIWASAYRNGMSLARRRHTVIRSTLEVRFSQPRQSPIHLFSSPPRPARLENVLTTLRSSQFSKLHHRTLRIRSPLTRARLRLALTPFRVCMASYTRLQTSLARAYRAKSRSCIFVGHSCALARRVPHADQVQSSRKDLALRKITFALHVELESM